MRSVFVALSTFGCVFGVVAGARAQIDRPGQHVSYKADLEPHFIVQWDEERFFDEGFGLGFHASIPVMDNGPVPQINNGLAVIFGLDWAHFEDDRCRVGDIFDECSGDDFWFPIAAQWNFYFSDLISTRLELGLAVQHARGDDLACVGNACVIDDRTDTDIEPVLWIGVRLHVSRDIAISLRVGTPSLLLGAIFYI